MSDLDFKHYGSDYYDVLVINIALNVEHHSNSGEIKVGQLRQIIMVGFNDILGPSQEEELMTMRQKLKDGMVLRVDFKKINYYDKMGVDFIWTGFIVLEL